MSIAESGAAVLARVAHRTGRHPGCRVAGSVSEVETVWRALAASGHATPFQQPDFVAAALASRLDGAGVEPFIVLAEDATGQPQALFPLVIERRFGLRVARFAGGAHASYKMGVFAPGFGAREAAALGPLLREAGLRRGVDLFALADQPLVWEGFVNPLAELPHQPSPCVGYSTRLDPDPMAFVRSKMSNDSYKKLLRKEKRLGEAGALRFLEPVGEEEVRPVLDAYLRQKAERFRALGMQDPFAGPEVREFLRQATGLRPGGRPAAISLHALASGERVLAVFGGAAAGGRFSAMFTSFDASPDVARFSPGDCLLLRLVTTLGARGFRSFDLGVGEAGYKKDYCDATDGLFDTFLPLTAAGRAAAAVMGGGRKAKGWLKASPLLMRAVGGLRRLKSNLRPAAVPARDRDRPAPPSR